MKGVAVTEVDLDGGRVMVDDTKAVKPESLAEKVRVTGFNSEVAEVLTPEQFRLSRGKTIGQDTASSSQCCGKGGCDTGK